MTHLVTELGGAARSLARQGVVVTVVLSLALGITASWALAVLERAEGGPS
jgi:hypothetical protein